MNLFIWWYVNNMFIIFFITLNIMNNSFERLFTKWAFCFDLKFQTPHKVKSGFNKTQLKIRILPSTIPKDIWSKIGAYMSQKSIYLWMILSKLHNSVVDYSPNWAYLSPYFQPWFLLKKWNTILVHHCTNSGLSLEMTIWPPCQKDNRRIS